MAKLLKLRRGSTTEHGSFTGAEGEVTVDTTKDTAVVHDGAQAGGRPLAREDMSNVSSASIAGQLATDSIATTKIAAGALPTDVTIADANISGSLTIARADIVADAIDGTKITDSCIDSEHYVDGSIDVEHLADNSVDASSIVNDAVTGAKIADDSINSEHYVDGSIDTAHIANDAVNADKLASDAVVTNSIVNLAVTSGKIADSAITNSKVSASAAVAGTKIAPDFGSQNVQTTGTISDGKGNVRSIPSNAQGGAYVAVAADAGKVIYISTGGVTINDGVFSAGDAVTIINNSGSDQTITQGTNVTIYNTADATTGNRTLAGRGMATIWFASAGGAYISGAGLS